MSEAITEWIENLKDGDSVAAEKLWQCYFQRIVELARKRLHGAKRAAADEEDVALSVFNSLCMGAHQGKFPALTDRDSLWSLLVAITIYKSVDLIRRENRKKRGGTGKAADDASDDDASDDDAKREQVSNSLSEFIRMEPTPSMIVQLEEQLTLLLDTLQRADDPELLTIALAKMQGNSTAEVAEQIGCVRRTVERKVAVIRRIWEQQCE